MVTDRYGREIDVGDIVLAKPLNHPDRKHVVGTIHALDKETNAGSVACFSVVPQPQVDRYDFKISESELIIKQDGTLAFSMTHEETACEQPEV